MRSLACLFAACCAAAYAQTPPRLGPATAIDVRVKSVNWQPHGSALIYERGEDTGTGVGIYRLGDTEGKVVLHLSKGAEYSVQWFDGQAKAIVIVTQKVQTGRGEGNEADVYLLDAKQRTSAQVFSKTVDAPDAISIEADLSPSLTHGIFTIHEGKKTYHAVLPANGGLLVASPDIDEAEGQGLYGPGWSLDGTALYFGLNDGDLMASKLLRDFKEVRSGTLKITFNTSDAESDLKLDRFVIRLMPPVPPAGTPVLEVMPSNGVLRRVTSRGPWVEAPDPHRL